MKVQILKSYLPKILFCILGIFLLGIGVAFTKISSFGCDPFNGSCFAVSAFLQFPYTMYVWCFNTVLFIFQILFGRRYIGFGTFINWFFLCYFVSFVLFLFGNGYEALIADNLVLRIVYLVAGLIIISLGLAVYQLCKGGIAPYDALPLIVIDYFPKIPFFWARMALDLTCMATILIFRGTFGVGTILTAFCLGPITHFFMMTIRKLSRKIFRIKL